jgi:hypothetical protein
VDHALTGRRTVADSKGTNPFTASLCTRLGCGRTLAVRQFSLCGWEAAVAVTRDQKGNDLLAQSCATATGKGEQETISVNLDLRRSKPGANSLSTTHELDQASYYYCLQIK